MISLLKNDLQSSLLFNYLFSLLIHNPTLIVYNPGIKSGI